jgi:hypothetical protein
MPISGALYGLGQTGGQIYEAIKRGREDREQKRREQEDILRETKMLEELREAEKHQQQLEEARFSLKDILSEATTPEDKVIAQAAIRAGQVDPDVGNKLWANYKVWKAEQAPDYRDPIVLQGAIERSLNRPMTEAEKERYFGIAPKEVTPPKKSAFAEKVDDLISRGVQPTKEQLLRMAGADKESPFEEKLASVQKIIGPLSRDEIKILAGIEPKPKAEGEAAVTPEAVNQFADDVKNRRIPFQQVPIKLKSAVAVKLGEDMPVQMSAATESKLDDKLSALDVTIQTLTDVRNEMGPLNSIYDASMVELLRSTGSVSGLASRALGIVYTTKEKEKLDKLAGDLRSASEQINIIRSPIGGTGFRGKEAWDAIQAQLARALLSPGVNKRTLDRTIELLKKLQMNTGVTLEGKGYKPPAYETTPAPAAGPAAAPSDLYYDAQGRLKNATRP